ncbi:hypothetical protein FQZ97_788890 [compost metagenome]
MEPARPAHRMAMGLCRRPARIGCRQPRVRHRGPAHRHRVQQLRVRRGGPHHQPHAKPVRPRRRRPDAQHRRERQRHLERRLQPGRPHHRLRCHGQHRQLRLRRQWQPREQHARARQPEHPAHLHRGHRKQPSDGLCANHQRREQHQRHLRLQRQRRPRDRRPAQLRLRRRGPAGRRHHRRHRHQPDHALRAQRAGPARVQDRAAVPTEPGRRGRPGLHAKPDRVLHPAVEPRDEPGRAAGLHVCLRRARHADRRGGQRWHEQRRAGAVHLPADDQRPDADRSGDQRRHLCRAQRPPEYAAQAHRCERASGLAVGLQRVRGRQAHDGEEPVCRLGRGAESGRHGRVGGEVQPAVSGAVCG